MTTTEASFQTGFRGARVLITGGLGFIGSNLALRLVALGAQVTLVDSLAPEYGGNEFNVAEVAGQVRILRADIRDESALQLLDAGQDYLFNLAGQTSHIDSMTDPQRDLEVNVEAQLSMLEACRQLDHPPRIVFASTRQIYGKPSYLPVDETHPLQPVDINGIHKIAGEMYHQLYGRVYDIPVTILRLTNTYGPRMRVKDERQTFLGTWIQRLLDGEPLLVFGDGSQLRDFNYVDDVTEALLHCAAAEEAIGKVYNLGSREVVSLEKLAQLMVGLRDGSYELVTFPGERKRIDIGDYYSDFSMIERDLGWQPMTGLEEGLATTLDYFARHRQHYWS